MKPKVFIGSTPADIENNISIVLRSPVFNENGTPGSFVFDFSVPLTNEIKKEISFSHSPGAVNKVYQKPITIIAGAFNLTGMGQITSSDENEISISLPVYNGSLKHLLAEKKLTELDLGEMTPIVEYKTHAGVDPLFVSFGYAETPHNIVDHPLRFGNLIADPHNTIGGAVYSEYHAPTTGNFTFSFLMNYKITFGRNLRISVRRNGVITVFSKQYADPLMGEDLSDVLSFSTNLNQGDVLQFRVRMDGVFSPNPVNPAQEYRAHIVIQTTSELFAYSEFNVGGLVDRGYPYNNFTFLPIHNNNYFANAQSEVFEIDHDSVDFINEKFPYVNYYNDGFPMLLSYSEGEETYQAFNIIAPQLFLAHVISKVFEEAGIAIHSNLFVSDGNINQLCIWANACVNNIVSSSFSQITDSYQLCWSLPDIPCLDFLMQVCKTLGIVFVYDHNTRTITFKHIDEIITDPTAREFSKGILGKPKISVNPFTSYLIKYPDIEDDFIGENFHSLDDVNYKGSVDSIYDLDWLNSQPNDCYFVKDLNAYLYYTRPAAGWAYLYQFYSLRFDFERGTKLLTSKPESVFEYELGATPIMMRNYPLSDPSWGVERDILTPASLRAGKIKGTKNDKDTYHLLFYRGLRKDSNNNDYPLGSNSYKDLSGEIDFSNSLTQPFDFNLNTDQNSLYTKRFRNYLRWRVRTHGTYTFFKVMTSHEIADFDFFGWYRIHGMDYLVKEIKFEITKEGISPAEITAMPRTSELVKLIPQE